MATVFFSYSHADEALRNQLETQLAMLKRQRVIETWHDRRIGAGQELHQHISNHVENDDIILLLVSPDFLASDYCYDNEMLRAMERHDAGEAIVIPVILRPSEGWTGAPFGKLNAVPADGRPVTLAPDRDQAFAEVARAIREAAGRLVPTPSSSNKELSRREAPSLQGSIEAKNVHQPEPRSSNLRLAKKFTERERDKFKLDTFEYIARFFDNSLKELEKRNTGIEGAFRRVNANRFTATVYQNGQAVTRCTVFMGDAMIGSGICYVAGESDRSNGFNESLSVDADDQSLFLRSMGMASYSQSAGAESKLSQEGAAELYWGMLLRSVQELRR